MATKEEHIGHLEDEAIKRKERLKALKRGDLKTLSEKQTESTNEEDADKYFPKPLFRNYNPKDDLLKSNVLPKPNLIEIENEIKDQLENSKPEPLIQKEIDLTTLAPQKVDWDLKRDLEKRMKMLEKRTQRAIVELIRDRLKQQKNPDFAELVSLGSRTQDKTKRGQSEGEEEAEEEDEDEEQSEQTTGFADNDSNAESSSPVLKNDKTEISDDDDY
jgi:coiled-coil domain-containing protein 12